MNKIELGKEKLTEAENNASEIAEYLLSLDPKRKFFNQEHGNFRLNTMLHISQMLYGAKTGKPLFKDPMYAYPPKYGLLNQTRQKKLSAIIHSSDPEVIKNKRTLIYQLYQEQKIKLTD